MLFFLWLVRVSHPDPGTCDKNGCFEPDLCYAKVLSPEFHGIVVMDINGTVIGRISLLFGSYFC
jgi:hypothetical protein